jgi:hypothetical protein
VSAAIRGFGEPAGASPDAKRKRESAQPQERAQRSREGGVEMSSDVAFEIANLAVSLAQAQTTGKAQQDATLSGILLQIIGKAMQAYHDHTGETLDPSLIKPERVL